MKKAQILGVLVVAGALSMAMSGEVLALGDASVVETKTNQVTKPSIVALINATNDAEIAAMEARQVGETGYTTYLNGLVEQGIKAQEEYAKRTAEDITELVSALSDGAYVTRLMIRTNSQTTQSKAMTTGTAQETPGETEKGTATVKATGSATTKQTIAKTNQTSKIVLTTPKVANTEPIKQISAPDTSAGKPVMAAASARNTTSIVSLLAVVVAAVGVVAKMMGKVLPKKARVLENVEN